MAGRSQFYAWLVANGQSDESLSSLTQWVLSDEEWPSDNDRLDAMIQRLATSGHEELIPVLRDAFAQCWRDLRPTTSEYLADLQERSLYDRDQLVPVAIAAFPIWLEMSEPSLAEVATLAARGHPGAIALKGVHHILGVNCDQNRIAGERMVKLAFDRGNPAAANILHEHFVLRRDTYASCDWLVKGAKALDRNCLLSLAGCHYFFQVPQLCEFIGAEETERVLLNLNTTEGELEWMAGLTFYSAADILGARAYFATAAGQGFAHACYSLSVGYAITDENDASRFCAIAGAEEGDLLCNGLLAAMALSADVLGTEPFNSPEDCTGYYSLLERSVEHGGFHGILHLVSAYSAGKHLPQDLSKARLYAALALLTGAPIVRQSAAEILENLAPTEEEMSEVATSVARWAIDCFKKTGTYEAFERAARLWYYHGMELPQV